MFFIIIYDIFTQPFQNLQKRTEAPPGASLKISENGTYFIPFS